MLYFFGIISDIAKTILEFSIFLQDSIHPRHNLDRQNIIRTLLYQAKDTFPGYNAAVFEKDIANVNLNEYIFDEGIEMQDLFSKFKIRIVIFKKGSMAILYSLNNGNRWGKYIE